MFKSRGRKAEEEAKLEENYRPTKDLEADEEKPNYYFPWTGIIIIASLVIIAIIIIVLIYLLGGPVK